MAVDQPHTMPRVGGSQAGPPDEILQRGRSMTREITLREFHQTLIATQCFCYGYSFFKKRVSELLTNARTTAHNPVQLSTQKNMRHANRIVRGYANPIQHLLQRRTRQVFPALQSLHQRLVRSLESRGIKFVLAIVWSTSDVYAWPRQLQQPANIIRRNEVPRRTQQVRAKYLAVVESLFNDDIRRLAHSERKRPLRAVEVLRLHCTQPAHHVHRFPELR